MTKIYVTDFLNNDIDTRKYVMLIKKIVNIDINYNRNQTLVAWMLLMILLNRNVAKKNILFKKNIYGKPSLLNNEVFFNISHSCQKVVVAISDNEIGVDIEKILSPNLKIVNRYFGNCEKEYIFSKNNKDEITKRFYIIWTLKESYLKFKGVGLNKKLDSFDINCLNSGNIELISDENIFFHLTYREIDEYILSCCSVNEYIEVYNINIENILNYYS